MSRTALVTTKKKTEYPILIIDKEGEIGEALLRELKNESLVVFVSKKQPEALDNIVYIPFLKKVPTIPDNTYSHIFLIDENNKTANELIQAFIKKAKNDSSSLNIIAGSEAVTKPFIEKVFDAYDKAKIIITGEIFKKDAIYNPHTNINKFIIQAKTNGKLLIPGEGIGAITPVYFDDVIEGILETVFGTDDKARLVYLFPKHKITFLSLANMFRKKDPELKIDFIKEGSNKQAEFIPELEGKYILGKEYNLEDKIKKIELEKITLAKYDQKKESYDERKKIPFYSLKLLFLSLVFLILLPAISTLLFAVIGFGSLYAVKNGIEKNNIFSSKPLISISAGSFAIAQESSAVLIEEVKLLGQEDKLTGVVNNINSGREISTALLTIIDASDKLKSILSGESTNASKDFSEAMVEFRSVLYVYNKEEQKNLIPQNIKNKLADAIRIASSTIDFWPDILGFNGSRTYLIIFQNNMELRPGGGFIGSYGILTLNQGRIASFNIYDVYDADGQLKGHVEPPFPVRRYLPSAHWYLRDSNFNVEFSKGAVASAVFLNSEMRQAVDGVIGVDLTFVKNILSSVEEVKVTDYKQTVNADNFFEIAQSHTEEGFFPGSTQKKDFLRSFYNSLQAKIAQEKNPPYLPLFWATIQSMNEKHLLFAFNDASEQTAFAVNGWSSALVDERKNNDSTINDFMGINEANFGANKVNYYITRNISQSVEIKDDGSIDEVLTIVFKNTSDTNSQASGAYKNYLRVILPLNTDVSSIQIDGKDQKIVSAITDPAAYEKKGFTAPDGLEVQKENQSQNTIYGFLINVQPQETKTIKLEYQLAQKIILPQPELTYSLKIFKQPGVDFYPYNLFFNHPTSFKVLTSSTGVEEAKNSAQLLTQIARDKEVTINLVAK